MTDSTKYASKLKGQKVLVFGGSSGIGFGAAEASIESGATVVISSSSQKKIDDAVARIIKEYPSAKGRVSGHACNLGDQSNLEKNIVDFLDKVGKVDHIIFTAGDSLNFSPLADITVETAIQSSMVRLYAPLMIGKHATKYMNAGPKSSLTLTTGSIVDRPRPNWVLPNTTMAAVEGLMQALALDLAPIRVNIVCPGAVETELWKQLPEEAYEQLKAECSASALTGNIGKPEELAEAYLYLMKDTNVTGISVKTHSGAMLK